MTITGQVASILDYLHWAIICVLPMCHRKLSVNRMKMIEQEFSWEKRSQVLRQTYDKFP